MAQKVKKPPLAFKINTALTIFLSLLAILTIYLSVAFYDSIKNFTFFHAAKFKKTNQKIEVLSTIAFYASTLILVLIVAKYIIVIFVYKKPKPENNNEEAMPPPVDRMAKLIQLLQNSISDLFQQTVIFMGLYSYLLFEGSAEKKILVIFPTLFLIGRIKVIFGSILQSYIVFNLSQFGIALTAGINTLIIAQALGFEPFWLVN